MVKGRNTISNTMSDETLPQLTPTNHKFLFTVKILSKTEYGIYLAIT